MWALALAALALSHLLMARAVDSIADRDALIGVYQSMGGAQWKPQTNWLSRNVSICLWYGVQCQIGCPTNSSAIVCRIDSLQLGYNINGVRGAIPPALMNLTALTSLTVSGAAVTGALPTFETLVNLKWLDVTSTSLVGSIPALDSLTALEHLDLNNNRYLQGAVPNFTNSVALQYIDLSRCLGLSGTIPTFSTLTQLQTLYLGHNKFVGSVPNISSLANLQYLDLTNNQLSGGISDADFAALGQLFDLRLGFNRLSGSIPNFAPLAQLSSLFLNSNQFTGTVPSFTALSNLQDLWLDTNQLYGSIPNFTALTQLTSLSLSRNRLSGAVPQFQSLVNLDRLYLARNELQGTCPEFATLTNLVILELQGNRLIGKMPAFSTLTKLRTLRLYDNDLNGTISDLAKLVKLQDLRLHNNSFSGELPVFPTLTALVRLSLSGNRLGGTLHSFSHLRTLQVLMLSENRIAGTLPQFSNTQLLQLEVSGNVLTGTLPSLNALAKLRELRLSRNQLSGSLPAEWRTLRALSLLDVAENSLSGEIRLFQADASMSPLNAKFVNLSTNQFGGELADMPPSLSLNALDIRNNQLVCPYPLFPSTLFVLRSICSDDWVKLALRGYIGAGCVIVALAIYVGVKTLLSAQCFKVTLFCLAWFVALVSLMSDLYSFANMVQYIRSNSNNCNLVNEKRVFLPQFPNGEDIPPYFFNLPDTFLFADWIEPHQWQLGAPNDLELIPVYISQFKTACHRAPECAYDAANARCFEAHPELATTGGDAHQMFLYVIIAIMATRGAYEVFCLAAVVVSCVNNAVLVSCRIWIKGSAFLPLMALRARSRASVIRDLVLIVTPPSEIFLEFFTSGLFVQGVWLLVNLYFLLQVTETGLAWSNWFSLVLGIVTVPRLMLQAAWSWWKLRREAREQHILERAESGFDFNLNELAGGSPASSAPESSAADTVRPENLEPIEMSILSRGNVTSSNFTGGEDHAVDLAPPQA